MIPNVVDAAWMEFSCSGASLGGAVVKYELVFIPNIDSPR
jgi:hypothetical protein